jgi:uncharacterized OsmC-like protein
VKASGGRLTAEAAGEIENEDGVLVIKRIHVVYSFRPDADAEPEKVQRAFEKHMPFCPFYRSIRNAIDVTTRLELIEA